MFTIIMEENVPNADLVQNTPSTGIDHRFFMREALNMVFQITLPRSQNSTSH